VSKLPYDATVITVTGEETTLESLRDKAVLVVNVASKCGLTPQYEQLEQLQKQYGPRGFQVVGFPCNQFAGQEPGTNEQIAEFCSATFGVTFPVFGKIKVNGKNKHAIYEALHETTDAEGKAGRVKWNFEKFLVAPGGEVVGRFRPTTTPDNPMVIKAIEAILPAGPVESTDG
jgi:glutathione peroxidase